MTFQERLESFGSSAITRLRPAQVRALDEYDRLRTDHADIGVELPTGAGKTLIALLIADQALEEGRSVAYLTGTKQLAEQAVAQAALLPGLDVAHFSGRNYPAAQLRAYNEAAAVGIMNYWTYFNTRPRVNPADVIVFDDAHLAEQALSGLFTIQIPRGPGGGSALYQAIADLVLQQGRDSYPSLQALRDGTAPWSTPPELISFVDWDAVASSVIEVVEESEYYAQSDISYPWRVVRPNLRRCGVLVGPNAIEIRPYHVPAQAVPGYAQSRLRVYLSATLGQTGDIQRRLGVRPVVTAVTDADAALTELGRRTFVINPTQDAADSEAAWSFAISQVEAARADRRGRAAWLCASSTEADQVQTKLESEGYTAYRLTAGDDAAVDRWRNVPEAQLVTAGRFDGLDFPDEVCRLVIIPSVPAASTEFERFVVAYLGDASFMRYRIGQRVTQALGRANRTPADSALYVGLDPAFGPVLADASVQQALGRDVRAAVNRALETHGDTWDVVKNVADDFWRTHRAPAPVVLEEPIAAAPGRHRPGRSTAIGARGESAPSEVNAATRLWFADGPRAAESANDAAGTLQAAGEVEHAAFWKYVEAHALFGAGRPADFAAARAALEVAVDAAPETAWFVRLRRTIDALSGNAVRGTFHDALFLSWDEWIREGGGRIQARLARTRPLLEGTHDQRCEALEMLARLCGATGDRPSGPSATDARWVWTTPRKGQRRIWEVKTGGSERVPRDDINQLLGQVQVEEQTHPRSRVVGCLYTALDDIEDDAGRAAQDKIVLFTAPAALSLWDAMAQRFVQYQSASGSGSATERGEARSLVEPRLPAGDWTTELLTARGLAFIGRAEVESLFAR